MAAHLVVACDVFGGVLFCAVFFPRGVLDEIWNSIESVSEKFLYLLFRPCNVMHVWGFI